MSRIDDALTVLTGLLGAATADLPEPLTIEKEGEPRANRGLLTQDVAVSYPSDDGDVARTFSRAVHGALRDDPTMGGVCERTVLDPLQIAEGRAWSYVRIVV